jgi:hypothetical protein
MFQRLVLPVSSDKCGKEEKELFSIQGLRPALSNGPIREGSPLSPFQPKMDKEPATETLWIFEPQMKDNLQNISQGYEKLQSL